MGFVVEVTPAAIREIKKLEKADKQIIKAMLEKFEAQNLNLQKLKGTKTLYRAKKRHLRIIFRKVSIETWHVIACGHRKQVYRNIPR